MPSLGLDRDQRLRDEPERFAAALRGGEAWDHFCAGLRRAGQAILRSQDAEDDRDLAEGFRYLLGLVLGQVESELYRTDAAAPAFLRVQSDVVKAGMDNPDAGVVSAPISDDGVYRIYGTVGEIRMVEVVISGGGRPVMRFLDEFPAGPDGFFELLLAREPQRGNWIEIPPGARGILVRRSQYDWDTEEIPHLAIERLDADPATIPRPLRVPTAADVGEQLDALGTLIADTADYWVDLVHSFRDEGDNVIPAPRPLPATGLNETRSSVKGFFVLRPDEALLVEFTPPEGLFWSISVGDIWYRTFDYSFHQTSLNGHQVRLDDDGVCRVVIAHRDPGVHNWLDTVGHGRGVVILRWVRVSHRPQPATRVVPFGDLDTVLPAGTARVTPDGRADAIARRADAVARRHAVPLTTRWSYSTSSMDPSREGK